MPGGFFSGGFFSDPTSDDRSGQALFDHVQKSLPRWLTEGKTTALEWLYAYRDIFVAVKSQGLYWLNMTFIDTAVGPELNQHALDRGTSRRLNEPDPALRLRLKSVVDVVTEPALKASVNAILAANGLTPCGWFTLRRDMIHLSRTNNNNCDRGFRIGHGGQPMAYVVILPYGTTVAIAKSITEYLRQFGPAGFTSIVEVRGVP